MPKADESHPVSDVLDSLRILHDELLPLYAILLGEIGRVISLHLSEPLGLSAKKGFLCSEYPDLTEWYTTRKPSKDRKGSKSPETIRLDVLSEEFQEWLFSELPSNWRVIATWYEHVYGLNSWSVAGISKTVTETTFLDVQQRRALTEGSFESEIASRRRELEILIEGLEKGVGQEPQFENADVDLKPFIRNIDSAASTPEDAPDHKQTKDHNKSIPEDPTITIKQLVADYKSSQADVRRALTAGGITPVVRGSGRKPHKYHAANAKKAVAEYLSREKKR